MLYEADDIKNVIWPRLIHISGKVNLLMGMFKRLMLQGLKGCHTASGA